MEQKFIQSINVARGFHGDRPEPEEMAGVDAKEPLHHTEAGEEIAERTGLDADDVRNAEEREDEEYDVNEQKEDPEAFKDENMNEFVEDGS